MTERVDLFVVGAGSGGVRAARFAANLGARVAVAESSLFGGTCVHAGCVPKKLLVYGSSYREELEDARRFGWDISVSTHSWAALRDAKDRETQRLGGVYRRLLDNAGVTVFEGRASIATPTSVRVGERTIEAEKILIATGSYAERLAVPGAELGITSDEAFHLERLPRTLTILGAGYIALEFAGIFAALGVSVRVVHRGPEVLRHFDDDVRSHVRHELEKRHIEFALGRTVRSIERRNDSLAVVTEDEVFESDEVMHCVGRSANTRSLGLPALGVALRPNGSILVDDAYRSNVPSILAVGDVIDRMQLTPVALAEATFVARSLFAETPPPPVDYRFVPTAVFSQPSVATVGLTEAQARIVHSVRVFRTTFRPLKNTVSGRDDRTLMKIIVDRDSDRVLGIHLVGPEAAEIIQGFAVALTCGATKAQLDATIGLHPTAAEELVTLRHAVD